MRNRTSERTGPIYPVAIKSRPGSADDTRVGKSSITILAIALLAGAAIYAGRSYLNPAVEESMRNESVLTGHLDPRLDDIEVLQDSDLPDEVTPPKVGEAAMFIRVTVLYPAMPRVPDPEDHRLVRVNGDPAAGHTPAHVETDVDEDGARVYLIFRVTPGFESADVARGETTVVEALVLE